MLRLTADDGQFSVSDEVQITVYPQPTAGSARIEFASDQMLLFGAPGQQRSLAVRVINAEGVIIPGAEVNWISNLPDIAAVSSSGPLTASVKAQATWSGPIIITVDYPPLGLSAKAYAVMGTPGPETVLISSNLVLDIDGDRTEQHQITLARTAETEQLQVGQILVTGDLAGVMVHILQVRLQPDRVILLVEPALITEAFKDLDLSVEGDPVLVTIQAGETDNSMTIRSLRTGKVLESRGLSLFNLIDSLECERGIVIGRDVSLSAIKPTRELSAKFDLKVLNSKLELVEMVLQGSIGADIRIKLSLQSGIALSGKCSATFPHITIPSPPVGVFNMGVTLSPKVGIDLAASAASLVQYETPHIKRSDSFRVGVRYTPTQGWQPLKEWSSDNQDPNKGRDNLTINGAMNARATLFFKIDTGVSINIGYPPFFAAELVRFNFIKFNSEVYDSFWLAAPVDPTRFDYTGPIEEAGGSVSADVDLDFKIPAFKGKLGRYLPLAIDVNLAINIFSDTWTFYVTPIPWGYVLHSPSSTCPTEGRTLSEGFITFFAAADTTSVGEVEFWASKNGDPQMIKLAEASFIEGKAQATYTPEPAEPNQTDLYTIFIRLRFDDAILTHALPLADRSIGESYGIGSFLVYDDFGKDNAWYKFFPDPNLRECVRAKVGFPDCAPIREVVDAANGELICGNLLSAFSADLFRDSCHDFGGPFLDEPFPIGDLAGIDLLINLESIALHYNNPIGDIGPIANLAKLKSLTLPCGEIEDASPLKGLAKLEELFMFDNNIHETDWLAGLTQLTHLSLSYNNIDDIRWLEGLGKLQYLRLNHNSIRDISPLSGLVELKELFLGGNNIADISALDGLQKLAVIDLSQNELVDIDIHDRIELENLFIAGNPIKRLRLDNLPALKQPFVDGSLLAIEGFPLEFVQINNMPNIEWLALVDNKITSVKLNNNPNIKGVILERNNIQDISLLEGFENIEFLYLADNSISNITPLASFTKLETLGLTDNPLFNLAPLASIVTLKYLGLRNIGSMVYNGQYQVDPIDLTPLYGLQNLLEIDLRDNSLNCDAIYNLQVALPATYIRSWPWWSQRSCVCLCADGSRKEHQSGRIQPCSQICTY